MRAISSIYPDNTIAKKLINDPNTFNILFDDFVTNFGRTFKVIKSYYLFFEFFGFHKKKLEIPIIYKQPTFNQFPCGLLKKQKFLEKDIKIIDDALEKISAEISIYVKDKLSSLKNHFTKLIATEEKKVHSCKESKDLYDQLFGHILTLFRTDFKKFIDEATRYLSWDVFCGINPKGLSPTLIRERQLGFWYQFWQNDRIILPFGKIIDDLSSYFIMKFSSKFKSYEDMVDSEALTYLITGNANEYINYLTYDDSNERTQLALGCIKHIEQVLNVQLCKNLGKVYLLDKNTNRFKEIIQLHENQSVIHL